MTILRAREGSIADTTRDGAGEFAVLVEIARLRRQHPAVGVVSVGDQNGMLRAGGERALRRAILSGVVVAKKSSSGSLAHGDDTLFLDAGGLDEAECATVLTTCLQRHGAPPAAGNPEAPTPDERAAIAAHLAPFRTALLAAQHARVVAAAEIRRGAGIDADLR